MEIVTKKHDKFTVVSLAGRLDATSSSSLEKSLAQLINNGEIFLIVDFEKLEYISSAGLRGILSGAKLAKTKKGEIFICSLKGSVEEVFRLTGFQSVFKVFPSQDDALKISI